MCPYLCTSDWACIGDSHRDLLENAADNPQRLLRCRFLVCDILPLATSTRDRCWRLGGRGPLLISFWCSYLHRWESIEHQIEKLFQREHRAMSATLLMCGLRRGNDIRFVMYGFYWHFNNLRFEQSHSLNDHSAARVVMLSVSSEIIKCRLLKSLSDHPTKFAPGIMNAAWTLVNICVYMYVYIYIYDNVLCII